MKTLFSLFFTFLPFFVLSQSPIFMELSEQQKVMQNAFSISSDSIGTNFTKFFKEKNPEILIQKEGSFFKFSIALDSLGCISNIEKFPNGNAKITYGDGYICISNVEKFPNLKSDSTVVETLINLIKKNHPCKILKYQEDNGEYKYVKVIYVTIIFHESEIEFGID